MVMDTNSKVFDLFLEPKVTMREGLIRVLEQKVDPLALKQDGEEDQDKDEDNALKREQGMTQSQQDLSEIG